MSNHAQPENTQNASQSAARSPKKGNSSHAKRLARAWAEESGSTYAQSLQVVQAAAAADGLPSRTDRDDMLPALDALRSFVVASTTPAASAAGAPGVVTRESGSAAILRAAAEIIDAAGLDGTFAQDVLAATQLRMVVRLAATQTTEEFSHLLNVAADEVLDAHGFDIDALLNSSMDEAMNSNWIGDEGPRDAINLLVNAAAVFHDDPSATLADVAARNYDEELETILDWCGR